MKKNCRFLYFTFVLSLSLSLAYGAQVNLSQNGKDLRTVSFEMRYEYERLKHRDWSTSTYSQRKAFLTYWYLKQAEDAKKAKIVAKQQAQVEKDFQNQKLKEKKREANIQKAYDKEDREYHRELDRRNRTFDRNVTRARRELDQDFKHQ